MSFLNYFTYAKITKKLLFNILISFLLVYFIFHSFYGNRGIIAYFKHNQKLEKAYTKLENLRAERIELQHKAKLLKLGDKDMLDEKARNILGVASPQEQVFTIERNNEN